jgi:long-chain acyl-CoA synthetase
MAARPAAQAVHDEAGALTYGELLARVDVWERKLGAAGVGRGSVCAYLGDYSSGTVALFVALMRVGAISVPFTSASEGDMAEFSRIAGVQHLVRFDGAAPRIEDGPGGGSELVGRFRDLRHPGLIVFTSGSTGKPKGILHDLERVLGKFVVERAGWRTLLLLMMDHFGGVNTLLSALAYGGTAICLRDRLPETVCSTIARTRADLLPTTPTFLNMIIASGAWREHDLSSIRMITYGAEPMSDVTLKRVREIFPHAQLKQTYGLSELGVLRSQSPDPASLWLKVGGDGFETRVVDGILQIRSDSSMVGYLNALSPIDADGWMSTGDLVEQRDGLVRFLGRVSEVINVGGQKVFPTEVEEVLLLAGNVADATVHAVPHPVLGQAVAARVTLLEPEERNAMVRRLQDHCRDRLQKFKVPMRFEVVGMAEQANARAKKRRPAAGSGGTSQ